MYFKATREGDECCIASRIELADSFWKRFCGLMLRAELPEGHGLLLDPCNQIHMMFMKFPIDAVFLDPEDRVVICYRSLKPWWGLSSWHRNAVKVLELPAETLSIVKVQPGDRLVFQEILM